jgi:hypothetical protein
LRYDLTSSDPWNPNIALSSKDDGDWELPSIGAIKRSHMVPELYCDAPGHIISCLETLNLNEASPIPHEADVLAHESEYRRALAVSRDMRQSIITDKILAKRWQIGLDAAARALKTTTQEGMRFVQGPIERRL